MPFLQNLEQNRCHGRIRRGQSTIIVNVVVNLLASHTRNDSDTFTRRSAEMTGTVANCTLDIDATDEIGKLIKTYACAYQQSDNGSQHAPEGVEKLLTCLD